MFAQKEWPFVIGLGMNRAGRMIAACRREEGETFEAQMSASSTLSKKNLKSLRRKRFSVRHNRFSVPCSRKVKGEVRCWTPEQDGTGETEAP